MVDRWAMTESRAWFPSGWVYANLPCYGATKDATGHWFNDDVWVNDRTTQQWAKFRARLNHGRLFFNWPYVYAQNQGKWYYINQGE
jgi:hypothetical protein